MTCSSHYNIGENNPMFGREHSLESRKKMWKREKVGLGPLHRYMIKRIPKPQKCQKCGVKPPYDLANISGRYLEDRDDWEWLCRRCHMITDGRMKNLLQNNPNHEVRSEAAKRATVTRMNSHVL